MIDQDKIERLKQMAIQRCGERLSRAAPVKEYGITTLHKSRYGL